MISVFDLLVLSQIPGIGTNRLRTLVSHFGDTALLFEISAREISKVEGFNRKLSSSFVHFIRSPQVDEAKKYAERQLSRLNKIEAKIITYWDKKYPEALKKIFDPPAYIFICGDILENDKYGVAVVGSRTPSEYGKRIAEQMSHDLAKLGIVIISGLARGVDTIAHNAAIKTNGRTLAVIGSGLDIFYPPENKYLYGRIAQQGAVLTEYEIGAKPDAVNFPRRNRLISGLSLGTLVIETDINGGAMITATMALDQNREVFAVPGNTTSKLSRGCHALIKEGRAKLVENIDDILSELSTKLKPILKGKDHESNKPLPPLNFFEKAIYDVLLETPVQIDVIAEIAKIATSDALVNLLSLEFKGLVKQLPGKMFVKN